MDPSDPDFIADVERVIHAGPPYRAWDIAYLKEPALSPRQRRPLHASKPGRRMLTTGAAAIVGLPPSGVVKCSADCSVTVQQSVQQSVQ